ncbi:MAG: sensor histidine kinase [Acaryochloridaceae cyanobacterium RL_2_7]|nr:sensor histidine kinase [Acaryochloridaceae cyanobacterium RL_2_7]
MAKLVELTFPNFSNVASDHGSEAALSHLSTCQLPVAQADDSEWSQGLQNWIISLTKQFQCQWSVWLSYDLETQEFYPAKFFSTNHRTKLDEQTSFGALSSVDEKLVTRTDTAVALMDLKEDLRLVAWRDQLLAEGMQSVLMTRLTAGEDLKDVLLLGNTTARAWTVEEADDLFGYARQLAQAQQRRALHQSMLQETRLNNLFRKGFHTLQSTKSTQSFVDQAAQILVNLCDVSGCVILLWSPTRDFAKVKALANKDHAWLGAQVGTQVNLGDPLIHLISESARSNQTCLSPVQLSVEGLSPETQEWLSVGGGQSIVGFPLQPQPKQSVFGAILLLSSRTGALTDLEHKMLSDLARYMAWVLCSSHVTESWRSEYEALHTLHWYQNKMLGHAYEGISPHLEPMHSHSSQSVQVAAEKVNAIVTRLNDQIVKLIPDLDMEIQSVTLVRLLREIIDRLEPVFAAKKIWVQVHHLKQSNLALKTSKTHLSFILDEVLRAATLRSEAGGRIDIWCRMNHPDWLDLSITDHGNFDPRFLKDIHLGHYRDRLKPSLLNEDVGQRLLACKTLTQKLGGKLDFLALEDDRSLTRFTLPCITQ